VDEFTDPAHGGGIAVHSANLRLVPISPQKNPLSGQIGNSSGMVCLRR
jgi:hypothetical protein